MSRKFAIYRLSTRKKLAAVGLLLAILTTSLALRKYFRSDSVAVAPTSLPSLRPTTPGLPPPSPSLSGENSPAAPQPIVGNPAPPAAEVAAKQALTVEARRLRDDWTPLISGLQDALPEHRHAAMIEWRQRNAPVIASIEAEFGGVLDFPEFPAELGGTGILPVPPEVAAARRPSPETRAFLAERETLASERKAVVADPDLPEPERMKLLADWELQNEERLRHHRMVALSLGLLNVELHEAELHRLRPPGTP